MMIKVLLLKVKPCFSLPIVTIKAKQNMVIHTQLNSSVWKFNGLHIGIVSANAGTGLVNVLLRYYILKHYQIHQITFYTVRTQLFGDASKTNILTDYMFWPFITCIRKFWSRLFSKILEISTVFQKYFYKKIYIIANYLASYKVTYGAN